MAGGLTPRALVCVLGPAEDSAASGKDREARAPSLPTFCSVSQRQQALRLLGSTEGLPRSARHLANSPAESNKSCGPQGPADYLGRCRQYVGMGVLSFLIKAILDDTVCTLSQPSVFLAHVTRQKLFKMISNKPTTS